MAWLDDIKKLLDGVVIREASKEEANAMIDKWIEDDISGKSLSHRGELINYYLERENMHRHQQGVALLIADLPLADEAVHALHRQREEYRQILLTDLDSHCSQGLFGRPGIGKSYHHSGPVVIHEHHLSYGDEVSFLDKYKLYHAPLALTDPDEGLPEWQKRRNQSQRAKAALIEKMKKRKA
jgi:hypothetical protein